MLSFRLVLVTAAAGLCLWGLFSLLDNLKEPGLLRSETAIVVKGCDTLDSEETRRLCPPLLCQKALFDAKAFPLRGAVIVATDRIAAEERLIAGVVHASLKDPNLLGHFVCVAQGERIALARAASAAEIADAEALDGGWLEVLSATMRP